MTKLRYNRQKNKDTTVKLGLLIDKNGHRIKSKHRNLFLDGLKPDTSQENKIQYYENKIQSKKRTLDSNKTSSNTKKTR
jgi:hypothetical protein